MSRRKVMIQCLVTLNLVSFPVAAQVQHQTYHRPQNASEYIRILGDPSRDEWQQPDKVMTELGIEPGQSVADLGSDPGYFTLRLARVRGPGGVRYRYFPSDACIPSEPSGARTYRDRTTYYPLFWRALKPAGRLVNMDFHKQDLPVGPQMKISRTQMIQEAGAAGLRLDRQVDFLKYQFLLVFRR